MFVAIIGRPSMIATNARQGKQINVVRGLRVRERERERRRDK